jgi:chemotaxis protein CheX
MDVKFINPFIGATLHVLKTISSTETEAGKPFLKKDQYARGDVTGIIGLIGDVRGSVSVTFTEKCILSIVSKMFNEEIKGLNNEIKDAVGEITNMISGQARQELAKVGRNLKAAIPMVIMGKDHIICHITSHPIIAIPFTTQYGPFMIEVCFEE